MEISLKNKTAVICGSSQGIGLAVAKELALLGARCILIARNAEALAAVMKDLPAEFEQHHHFFVADFNDPVELKKIIELFVSQNPVHILINNTGGPAAGPIVNAKEEDFINAFNQHLICNHILTSAVIPSMKAEGYGRIINIISTSVKVPLPNLGVSNTIRGAVASWSKTMANELGQYNITVNSVLPGATRTQRLENIISRNADKKNLPVDEVEQAMMHEIPMKRFGEASEIASVVAFLASPAASYVNGVSIPVDGGRTGTI